MLLAIVKDFPGTNAFVLDGLLDEVDVVVARMRCQAQASAWQVQFDCLEKLALLASEDCLLSGLVQRKQLPHHLGCDIPFGARRWFPRMSWLASTKVVH